MFCCAVLKCTLLRPSVRLVLEVRPMNPMTNMFAPPEPTHQEVQVLPPLAVPPCRVPAPVGVMMQPVETVFAAPLLVDPVAVLLLLTDVLDPPGPVASFQYELAAVVPPTIAVTLVP